MGLTLPQTYRYVLLPNAYRVIVPPMTSEMLNLVKNSAIASTIGLVDWRRRRASCWITRRMPMNLSPLSPAYVGINTVIMLIMSLVERKIRLPGNREANNVRF